jgi:glycosyltransferase involved in cell wall biosynthesis
MRVTVLFSTFNGQHTLPRMLDTLERLEAPAGGWNVVAVDNGSTDDSTKLLNQRVANLPMTVISEPRRGKNVALNVGLKFVEGDIVALTDDDVILSPDWLISIEQIATQQPDYDIFGGAIVPVWEEPPPDWVLRCVPKGLLSCTSFQDGPIAPNFIWGPSMAVRTAVFRDLKFNEGIGPNGSQFYAMGSEGEFVVRAASRGHQCWHFSSSPVGHIIRPYQLQPERLLQRRYNLGRGLRRIAYLSRGEVHSQVFRYSLNQVPGLVYSGRNVAFAAYKVVIANLFGEFDTRFRASLQLRFCQGDFAERLAILANHFPAYGPESGS